LYKLFQYLWKKRSSQLEIEMIKKSVEKAQKDFIDSKYYDESIYESNILSKKVNENYKLPSERYLKLEDKVSFYQKSMEQLIKMEIDISKYNIHSLKSILPIVFLFEPDTFYVFRDVMNECFKKNFRFDLDLLENVFLGISDFEQHRIAVLNEYEKEFFINQNGVIGEERVNKELDLFSDHWHILKNVRLEVDGKSVETDNIILAEQGIFSVEVKNFSESGSYSLRITSDGQWLKVFKDGKVEPMKDVWSQVNRHIFLKEKFINQHLKEINKDIPYSTIQPIVVIANDNILIDNQSDLPIMRISQVYRHVKNGNSILDKHRLHLIKELFENHNKDSKSYPVLNYLKGIEGTYETLVSQLRFIETLDPIMENFYQNISQNKKLVDELVKWK